MNKQLESKIIFFMYKTHLSYFNES